MIKINKKGIKNFCQPLFCCMKKTAKKLKGCYKRCVPQCLQTPLSLVWKILAPVLIFKLKDYAMEWEIVGVSFVKSLQPAQKIKDFMINDTLGMLSAISFILTIFMTTCVFWCHIKRFLCDCDGCGTRACTPLCLYLLLLVPIVAFRILIYGSDALARIRTKRKEHIAKEFKE